MKLAALSLLASCILLLGCEHTSQSKESKPLPATVIDITPTMKAEIQQAIVTLKGGVPPLLSDTVFVHSSELLLEHGRAGTDLGRPILGAHNLPVQGFRLQKREIGCVLYHPQSQKYVLLKTVPCQVEELK